MVSLLPWVFSGKSKLKFSLISVYQKCVCLFLEEIPPPRLPSSHLHRLEYDLHEFRRCSSVFSLATMGLFLLVCRSRYCSFECFVLLNLNPCSGCALALVDLGNIVLALLSYFTARGDGGSSWRRLEEMDQLYAARSMCSSLFKLCWIGVF